MNKDIDNIQFWTGAIIFLIISALGDEVTSLAKNAASKLLEIQRINGSFFDNKDNSVQML